MKCPECKLEEVRSVSKFDVKLQRWNWYNACNLCGWEEHDEELTMIHLQDTQ